MTINTAEIEARDIVYQLRRADEQPYKIDKMLQAADEIVTLRAALKAETARAEAMERMWEIALNEAREANGALSTRLHQETNALTALGNAFEIERDRTDRLTAQLTAANEKVAAARERDLRLIEWLCCLLDEVKPDETTKAQAVKFLAAFNTGDGNGR